METVRPIQNLKKINKIELFTLKINNKTFHSSPTSLGIRSSWCTSSRRGWCSLQWTLRAVKVKGHQNRGVKVPSWICRIRATSRRSSTWSFSKSFPLRRQSEVRPACRTEPWSSPGRSPWHVQVGVSGGSGIGMVWCDDGRKGCKIINRSLIILNFKFKEEKKNIRYRFFSCPQFHWRRIRPLR